MSASAAAQHQQTRANDRRWTLGTKGEEKETNLTCAVSFKLLGQTQPCGSVTHAHATTHFVHYEHKQAKRVWNSIEIRGGNPHYCRVNCASREPNKRTETIDLYVQ